MAVSGEPQTFWDHLEELRKSIFRVLVVLATLTVTVFFFKNVLAILGFLHFDILE